MNPFDEFDPSPGVAAENPQPSVWSRIGRGFGLGSRAMLEGVASLPGLIDDATALPFNALTAGYNAVTGSKHPYIPRGGDQFRGALDAIGLPKPNPGSESIASGIVGGAAGALGGAGAAGAVARSPMVGQAARAIAAMLARQPGLQAASGAAAGGVAEETNSPMAGLGAGVAVPIAASIGRRVVTPFPNANLPGRQALVDAAEKEGIPLTAAQATNNAFLKNVDAVMEQMPFTGGPQRAIRNDQNGKFIEAAWRKAGETANDTSPGTINTARDRIGKEIGDIANRNTLAFTPWLDDALAGITENLRFIPAESAGPVRARIEQLRGMVVEPPFPGAPPEVPGAAYRMLDSAIGRSIRGTSNGDMRGALGDLRETLRTAMDDSITPADKAAWDIARRQYASMSVIAGAAGQAGAGAAEGLMSPLALRAALVQSIGKGNYELGRGDLNELSRIGQGLLRPPPDSGTAGRGFAHNLLTGSVGVGGAGLGAAFGGPLGAAAGAAASVAGPRLAQILMNTGPGQAYLRNQIAREPVLTRNLAAAIALHGASRNTSPAGP